MVDPGVGVGAVVLTGVEVLVETGVDVALGVASSQATDTITRVTMANCNNFLIPTPRYGAPSR